MGVNTIIIQQEKMSVPAKILSEENLLARPLNDIYSLEEAQKEFIRLVDYVRSIIPPQRKEIRKLKYQFAEGNMFARTRMIEMHLRLA